MDRTLLNPNQQRRVATHLRLLREDLQDVASWPELARFQAEFAGRSICERELTEKPRPVTGRPGEPDAIAKLQQALATGPKISSRLMRMPLWVSVKSAGCR